MKPLRWRLETVRKEQNVSWEVLERDYVLSWILVGIGSDPLLSNSLIFKGGTCLKKCYFGNYRFSEDLDFTALENAPKDKELENIFQKIASNLEQRISDLFPISIDLERYLEKKPHPHEQEAFVFRIKLPWHRTPHIRVFIEISYEETLVLPCVKKKIIHEYGETFPETIQTYCLEEIIIEKLRAILQHTKKIHERGWSRSRSRDYYDIWRIFNSYEDQLQLKKITDLLKQKCEPKQISFKNSLSFFEKPMMLEVKQNWDRWLKPLVRDLPSSEVIINNLQKNLKSLFD